MRKKVRYRISEYVFNQLLDLDYPAMVKAYVAFAITEEGLSDAVWERWGREKRKEEYLVVPVSRTLKENEKDREIPEKILRHIKIYLSGIWKRF